MRGMLFVVVTPDPRQQGRMQIKLGTVKSAIGETQWLMEFQANGYKFSNVIPADRLGNFAFFDTAAERQLFIDELTAAAAPSGSEAALAPSPAPPLQ